MQEREISISAAPRPRQYTAQQRKKIIEARKKRRAIRRRNQCIFLALCAVVLVLLVVGFVKLVGLAFGAIRALEWPAMPNVGITAGADQVQYDTVTYDLSGYQYDPDDPRLVLVNANLPLDAAFSPATQVADATTGALLEQQAAQAYSAMASAARTRGISFVLVTGYRDAAAQQLAFDEQQAEFQKQGYSEQEAYGLAQSVVALPGESEHQTGYAADIVSEEYPAEDLGCLETAAFAWLSRYAVEYGFVLRYPEDKQMITGIAYEPWHWRYVGVENAKAMVQQGLSLEEFIECEGVVQ